MKDINEIERSKEVIRGDKLSREALYYTILFGAASLINLVLLIFSIVHKNSGLTVYTSILEPLFILAALIALRCTLISQDTIYIEDKTLVIKRFFETKRIAIANIDKLSCATDTKGETTQIKIVCGKETMKFKYKNFTKENVAHIKRAVAKH